MSALARVAASLAPFSPSPRTHLRQDLTGLRACFAVALTLAGGASGAGNGGGLLLPLLPSPTPQPRRGVVVQERRTFIDKARVQVIGGTGGKGVISFEHATDWKRKPIGGRGGKGGDVILQAHDGRQDLNLETFVIRGRAGKDASGNKGSFGRDGKPKTILVPVGTIVREVERVYLVDEEEAVGPDGVSGDGGDGWGATAAAAQAEEQERPSAAPFPRKGGPAGGAGTRRRRSGRHMGAGEGESSDPLAPSTLTVSQADLDDVDKLRSRRAKGVEDLFSPDADGYGGGRRGKSSPAVGAVAGGGGGGGRGGGGGGGTVRINKNGLAFRETTSLLVDLSYPGQRVLVARGGAPGVGNRGSLLTFAEQKKEELKPHTKGMKGEMRFLELELKTIADVGLVGFPNAGKSSFLGAVSKVSPSRAQWPRAPYPSPPPPVR
jgi:GTPase involved in cell partitioning and DNA repair